MILFLLKKPAPPSFSQAAPASHTVFHIFYIYTSSLFLKYISLIRSNVISESRLFSSLES